MKKLIIYISPGHQCTEFVPWLINNSPDMSHTQSWNFPDDWTEYTSSWGEGWEPMDSQWTFDNDDPLRLEYKQVRASATFNPEFMKKYAEQGTGTHCIFFNVSNPKDYKKWTDQCREWFNTNSPDTELVFAGHTMDLSEIKKPSLYFIKEGYILDEISEMARDRILAGHTSVLGPYLQRKITARYNDLLAIYKECNFDYIFELTDIEDIDKCRELVYSIVTLPELFDCLHTQYFEHNQIDPEVESIIKEKINGFYL